MVSTEPPAPSLLSLLRHCLLVLGRLQRDVKEEKKKKKKKSSSATPETLCRRDPKPRVLRPSGNFARARDVLPACQVSGLLRKVRLLFLEVYDVFQLPGLIH